MVDFSGVDASPDRSRLENELRRYSAQCCTTVPEIVLYPGPGLLVDCKEPNLQEWILQLNKTPHTRGYTMNTEQGRPRLQPEDIYALAHKDVSEREALDRLNKRDETTMTYTHRPSDNKSAVNAVNANATADPNTAKPTDTSVNAAGTSNPRRRKRPTPGLNRQTPFGFRVPNIGNNVNKQIWNTILIVVSPVEPLGRVSPVHHAMTSIEPFRVSLQVVKLRVVVAINWAARAMKEEKDRSMGADAVRSAQGSPHRKKKASGNPLTLRWLSLLRES